MDDPLAVLRSSNTIPREIEMALRERLGIGAGAFPIGGVYTSITGVDPSVELGYGTWAAFATGQTLVGVDTGQTEFNTVLKTGGEKTHTLVTAEMPSHRHSVAAGGLTQHGGNNTKLAGAGGSNSWDPDTDLTGGDGAHNNLQPYITVYFWKRTA